MTWYDIEIEGDGHETLRRYAVEASSPEEAEKIALSWFSLNTNITVLYVEPDEDDNPEFDLIIPLSKR